MPKYCLLCKLFAPISRLAIRQRETDKTIEFSPELHDIITFAADAANGFPECVGMIVNITRSIDTQQVQEITVIFDNTTPWFLHIDVVNIICDDLIKSSRLWFCRYTGKLGQNTHQTTLYAGNSDNEQQRVNG